MTRLVFAIGAATTVWACGGGGQSSSSLPSAASVAAAAAPQSADGGSQSGYFTVPDDQLPHLQVEPVRKMMWSAVIRTTGTVDWDNDRTTQAISQVTGPITRIVADTGTRVKAGDPLLYVASSDISNSISTYRKARNRFTLAQHMLDRNKDLFEHKALSQRDLEAAQADYNDAATDLQSSLQALKIYDVRQPEIEAADEQNAAIKPELVMRAPIAGTVVQKVVFPGQFIQVGTTPAFVISNTATVWVQGHLYDKDLATVHVGDKVDERNSALPQTFHGVVSYIGDMLDPLTRTTPVRIVTENPDGLLKKDLFVDVVIHDRSTHDVLAVPTAAVLYNEQNFPFVYAQVDRGRFAQRLITLGEQQGDDTQVVEGLTEGTPVVSQGSVFLQFANSYQQ
jgi:cobalt-zinc-cadmium efflux system membrane fusion protein